MAKRKGISKKTRFEVFKRDSFKCQFCGASAPDVILEIDHLMPVSKGGDNDLTNLITSCKDCNAGKSDRELDDQSIVAKQRQQLEDLSERREQLKLMMLWRQGLRESKDDVAEALAEHWAQVTIRSSVVNETGLQLIRKWLRQFSIEQITEAMDIAADQYFIWGDNGKLDSDSAELAFHKVSGIAKVKAQPDHVRELYYIRGILRNRLSYVNENQVMQLLRNAHDAGVEVEQIKDMARSAGSWTAFAQSLMDIMEG